MDPPLVDAQASQLVRGVAALVTAVHLPFTQHILLRRTGDFFLSFFVGPGCVGDHTAPALPRVAAQLTVEDDSSILRVISWLVAGRMGQLVLLQLFGGGKGSRAHGALKTINWKNQISS